MDTFIAVAEFIPWRTEENIHNRRNILINKSGDDIHCQSNSRYQQLQKWTIMPKNSALLQICIRILMKIQHTVLEYFVYYVQRAFC